jgi:hypothetical protein
MPFGKRNTYFTISVGSGMKKKQHYNSAKHPLKHILAPKTTAQQWRKF